MTKYVLLLFAILLILGASIEVPTPLTATSIEHVFCDNYPTLITTDDDIPVIHFRQAVTITGVACHSDAAITISMADLAGDDIDDGGSGNQICTTGTGVLTFDTALTGTTTFAAGEGVEFDSITESTPTWTTVCLSYTLD